MKRFFVVAVTVFLATVSMGHAQSDQDVVWVQIEARPSLVQAQERAREYAGTLEDVAGFDLGSGWFAIALGPYTRPDAEQVLRVYRAQGLIPRDSYIAFSRAYRTQFWPQGQDIFGRAAIAPTQEVPSETVVVPVQEPETPPQQPQANAPVDETPAEARRSERALSRAERESLQIALNWAGFYNGAIDGAFGRGTRASMSNWQSANGFEPTGILTTSQRIALVSAYTAILDGLGMQIVQDLQAGLQISMPSEVVSFDRYTPPFATYARSGALDASVLLISQAGDRATLSSLYDVMQTLEIVPLEGPRALQRDSFTLVGRSDKTVSETRVTLVDGQIKGFTLIWPANDEARRTRIVAEMAQSITRLGGVLDPTAGASQQIDLVAGFAVRKPRLSRSGFYVDTKGTVLTTLDAVQSCTRITLDDTYEANLGAVDTERGIAVITPNEALAPPSVARFTPESPPLQSEIAVAGYSYEGILNAPSVTFGTLSDLRGLRGEAMLNRLAVTSLPGDAGGPVLDAGGNVLGMLLPAQQGGRQLPENVQFALTSPSITDFAIRAGLDVTFSAAGDAVAPEDIALLGTDMTVLVSCWD